ncbi:hypothetical protein BDW59DRAFT_100872 [Aspergillus cavernicola]|uniref:Secreted protein n=1 Tax=Aspergillus cavernicola TaxID=176166 RepID=A0ABR4I4V1_9EURO
MALRVKILLFLLFSLSHGWLRYHQLLRIIHERLILMASGINIVDNRSTKITVHYLTGQVHPDHNSIEKSKPMKKHPMVLINFE